MNNVEIFLNGWIKKSNNNDTQEKVFQKFNPSELCRRMYGRFSAPTAESLNLCVQPFKVISHFYQREHKKSFRADKTNTHPSGYDFPIKLYIQITCITLLTEFERHFE